MLRNLLNQLEAAVAQAKGLELSADDTALLKGLSAQGEPSEARAYAVLLVDLALADQHFDKRERRVIEETLIDLFKVSVKDAGHLIGEARNIVSSFRDPSTFIKKIKEEYSYEERNRLYEVIERIIAADERENPSEIYLRAKFRNLLK